MLEGRTPSPRRPEQPRGSIVPWLVGALLLLLVAFSGYVSYSDRQYEASFPRCEVVAGDIHKCSVLADGDRVETVFVSGTVASMPDRAFVRSLERGFTAGPAAVAVNPCGARPVIYVLDGLVEIDTTGAAFDAEVLNGYHAPTRDSVEARRDSILAATPPECLVRSEV